MFRITDECIACTLCERDCPVGAVVESTPIAYAINNACDDCKNQTTQLCVQVCPVDCIVLDFTEHEMLEGLAHRDSSVRIIFAKVNGRTKLPPRVVESGLTDPDDEVRAAFAGRADFTPVAFQVERGLIDASSEVRNSFALRRDILMTSLQIERGLKDASDRVRTSVSSRWDFTPTAEQIERGLTDPCISVRCNFIERADCELTAEQFQRAGKDSSAGVSMRLYHKRRGMPDRSEPQIVSRT